MTELLLTREKFLEDRTIGRLCIGDVWCCWTLEDRVREVEGQHVLMWKIRGITAIPRGRYPVVLEDSPRFGKDCLTLIGVPGFSYIRIHGGNRPEDTDGCILLGLGFDEATGNITQSRAALKELRDILVPELHDGNQVWITVR